MITSTSNQRLRRLYSFKRKTEQENTEGVFIVEGIRMVREIT